KPTSSSASAGKGDAPSPTSDPAKKPSVTSAGNGQNNKAPTPESIIHSVQSGVDKLIGSVIHAK
ncbi:MAG TPA: hypothetical protein VHU91_03380, partial [Mycobacteriales bacterium]|nr:hypothetical protein [Mycobacteriales bacterium]